jgi:preprotein translocase subunit SecG
VTFFIILHALVCLFLVIVILLQPGKGDAGVGFGSSSQSIFGSKGAGNFLTKLTSICAAAYLILSFALTRSRIHESSSSVINDSVPTTEKKAPVEAPKAAEAPAKAGAAVPPAPKK